MPGPINMKKSSNFERLVCFCLWNSTWSLSSVLYLRSKGNEFSCLSISIFECSVTCFFQEDNYKTSMFAVRQMACQLTRNGLHHAKAAIKRKIHLILLTTRSAAVFIRKVWGTTRVVIACFSPVIVCHEDGMITPYKGLLKDEYIEWYQVLDRLIYANGVDRIRTGDLPVISRVL